MNCEVRELRKQQIPRLTDGELSLIDYILVCTHGETEIDIGKYLKTTGTGVIDRFFVLKLHAIGIIDVPFDPVTRKRSGTFDEIPCHVYVITRRLGRWVNSVMILY